MSNSSINYKNKIIPANNEIVYEISNKYCLEDKEIVIFYKIFENLSSSNEKYLTKKDFLYFFKEIEGSVMSLYIYFLFDIIEKKGENFLEFNEWIKGIIEFVNLNKSGIHQFLFKMIDKNNDEIISIKDIINFISIKNNDKYIFPVNEIYVYKNLDLDRFDHIKIDQFITIISHNKINYLVYPCFRMQEYIKRNIINENFWKELNEKIYEKENSNEKEKKNKEKEEEILKQNQEQILKKKDEYKKIYEDIIGFNKNNQFNLKKNMFIRNPLKRSSFSIVNNLKKYEIDLKDKRINKSYDNKKFNFFFNYNENNFIQNSIEVSLNKDTINFSKMNKSNQNSIINNKKKIQNFFN